jgi:hypothetical protein
VERNQTVVVHSFAHAVRLADRRFDGRYGIYKRGQALTQPGIFISHSILHSLLPTPDRKPKRKSVSKMEKKKKIKIKALLCSAAVPRVDNWGTAETRTDL